MNPLMAAENGIADGGWIYVESQWGSVRCMARFSETVEPGTVWTWNAIGKASGAWNLGAGRERIAARLPAQSPDHRRTARRDEADDAARVSNSDPVTGQAAWYDVRVRVYPAEADAQHTLPQFDAMHALPGSNGVIIADRADLLRGTRRICGAPARRGRRK